MKQAMYKLLTLNKNAATSVYEMLKKLKGLNCIVRKPSIAIQPVSQYQPGHNRSIFGLEDLTDYEEWEAYEDNLLLFNIFQEGSVAIDEYDTFLSDAYCLTTLKEKLPLQTLIEVNFLGKRMYFKVDDHRNLTADVAEQLFVKNMLVPAT